MTDAIREALTALREAWDEAASQIPQGDPERRSAVLTGLDTAILEAEDALRAAGAEPDDE